MYTSGQFVILDPSGRFVISNRSDRFVIMDPPGRFVSLDIYIDIVNKGNPLAEEDITLVITTVFGRKQRYCFSDKQTS